MRLDAETYPYLQYDVAFVTSDYCDTDLSWKDYRDLLGDWLASFYDRGGTVVQFMFSLCEGDYLSIGGAWEQRGLDLITPSDQDEMPYLVQFQQQQYIDHCLFFGISSSHCNVENDEAIGVVVGGSKTFFSIGDLRVNTTVLSKWSNGTPAVVVDDPCGETGFEFLKKDYFHEAHRFNHNDHRNESVLTKPKGLRIACNTYPISANCGIEYLWPRVVDRRHLNDHKTISESYPRGANRKITNAASVSEMDKPIQQQTLFQNGMSRLMINLLDYGTMQSIVRRGSI